MPGKAYCKQCDEQHVRPVGKKCMRQKESEQTGGVEEQQGSQMDQVLTLLAERNG